MAKTATRKKPATSTRASLTTRPSLKKSSARKPPGGSMTRTARAQVAKGGPVAKRAASRVSVVTVKSDLRGSSSSRGLASPARELKPSKTSPRSALARATMLPPRDAVPTADTWNLDALFESEAAWEAGLQRATALLPEFTAFAGKLGDGPAVLRAFFELDNTYSRLTDRLGNFAFLRAAEDQAEPRAQSLRAKFQHLATLAGEAVAFFRPELLALPQSTIDAYLASADLADFKLAIERIVRYRPHTLNKSEERLLAMQGQMADAASSIFRQLNDADLKFGTIVGDNGKTLELGHSSFSSLLNSPKRDIRKGAFHQYYAQYDAHKNTIAASLGAAVHRDVYYAKARNFATAREASLFADNVPTTVYDNLVSSVRSHLPSVHRYLDIRRRAMKLKAGDLHHYDTYVPILADLKKHHTWQQAVDVVCDSLAPLGTPYVDTLREGLTTARWADRYPNAGKQSGAFSSGCFDSPPYILMNFRDDVLEHVFTLTHEAGHSMHSWHSVRHQPYQYSDYVIFVAEVASTFNEQLLARHLMANAADDRERAYLINRQIDGIRGTIVRQTMFAEFERDIHAMAEAGEPLTVESLRATYRKLLEAYFGAGPKGGTGGGVSGFVIDPELDLECLRIPHFYRGFYVYKYATGLSAAITLAQRVLSRAPGALNAYLSFLKSGGSKFPLDLLKDAGVDMTTPTPVNEALSHFDALVSELDELL